MTRKENAEARAYSLQPMGNEWNTGKHWAKPVPLREVNKPRGLLAWLYSLLGINL